MKTKSTQDEFPLMAANEGVVLFYPHTPKNAISEVSNTLSTRWIGQGPKVEKFEQEFKKKFLGECLPLAVGSGTDALHLAYLLADIKEGDEVLVPVFTCTATNIPLLYIGAKIVFIDIDPLTMNVSIDDILGKITNKTKAIVVVDYGGVPCDYDRLKEICSDRKITLISDAAHSLGSTYKGIPIGQLADFTIYSFQAIKTLTTGDGGLLSIKDQGLLEKAKRLRWFGIDRAAKQGGIWENDITEVGYKYQMNDIAAAIGLAGLEEIDSVIDYRNSLFKKYETLLKNPLVEVVGKSSTEEYYNSSWLITILVKKDRKKLMTILRENNIESAQVHYRNDRYSIFKSYSDKVLKNMDKVENDYLVLPLHTKVSEQDVERICSIVNNYS
jgi:dTDP-4-amino-4,6-dideoxygalactose transaminase